MFSSTPGLLPFIDFLRLKWSCYKEKDWCWQLLLEQLSCTTMHNYHPAPFSEMLLKF